MKPSHEELNYRGKFVRQRFDQGAEERLASSTTVSRVYTPDMDIYSNLFSCICLT
jgi:hypothetical protein